MAVRLRKAEVTPGVIPKDGATVRLLEREDLVHLLEGGGGVGGGKKPFRAQEEAVDEDFGRHLDGPVGVAVAHRLLVVRLGGVLGVDLGGGWGWRRLGLGLRCGSGWRGGRRGARVDGKPVERRGSFGQGWRR